MSDVPVLGIDFGTTNSVVAAMQGDDIVVLENAEGSRTTPSAVYYTSPEERNRPLVGEEALNKSETNPSRVIRSIKRSLGDTDEARIDGVNYKPQEVASDIIRKLRTDAAQRLDVSRDLLTDVVITTPAYWEDDRHSAVIEAARLAGFENVRTIKEPAAAAIAYGQFEPGVDKLVGVYDLGGGTFDFAVVDVEIGRTGAREEYEVIASAGDPQLGGDDWDSKLVQRLRSEFENETGIDPLEEHPSDNSPVEKLIRKERLWNNAKQAKERLSNDSKSRVELNIPFLMEVNGEAKSLSTTVTQNNFEAISQQLLEQTVDPVYTALSDTDFQAHQLDEVILVGGSTRMPQVEEKVKSIFGMAPKRSVNPDEAVAQGAALMGNRDDILLLEVTPLSLGIQLEGDRFKPMIERNTRLPAKTTEVFRPASDGSTTIQIPIYQGERSIASENRLLDRLLITDMTPGHQQTVQVEVTFQVLKNGQVEIEATESTEGQRVSVSLEGENRLSDEYIREKVETARKMEELDRRRRKVIEAQNDAREAIENAQQLITRYEHTIDIEDIETVEGHINNVRSIRNDDTATLGELKKATEALNQWVLRLGSETNRSRASAKDEMAEAPSNVEEPTTTRESTPSGTARQEQSGDGLSSTWGSDGTSNSSDGTPVDPKDQTTAEAQSSNNESNLGDPTDAGTGTSATTANTSTDSGFDTHTVDAEATNTESTAEGSTSAEEPTPASGTPTGSEEQQTETAEQQEPQDLNPEPESTTEQRDDQHETPDDNSNLPQVAEQGDQRTKNEREDAPEQQENDSEAVENEDADGNLDTEATTQTDPHTDDGAVETTTDTAENDDRPRTGTNENSERGPDQQQANKSDQQSQTVDTPSHESSQEGADTTAKDNSEDDSQDGGGQDNDSIMGDIPETEIGIDEQPADTNNREPSEPPAESTSNPDIDISENAKASQDETEATSTAEVEGVTNEARTNNSASDTTPEPTSRDDNDGRDQSSSDGSPETDDSGLMIDVEKGDGNLYGLGDDDDEQDTFGDME